MSTDDAGSQDERAPMEQLEQLEQIKTVAKRMKRPTGTTFKLADGRETHLSNEMLDGFSSGQPWATGDWKVLFDLLLASCKPDSVLLAAGKDAMIPVLNPGQICFWIRGCYNSSKRQNSSWTIRTFEHRNPEVRIYAVRNVYPAVIGETVEKLVGIEARKLGFHYQRELGFRSEDHLPFQDAILFDMLLDLLTGDFKPNQRESADGPIFQLEILTTLEKEQMKAEAALGFNSAKRRLTIPERLEAKRLKTE